MIEKKKTTFHSSNDCMSAQKRNESSAHGLFDYFFSHSHFVGVFWTDADGNLLSCWMQSVATDAVSQEDIVYSAMVQSCHHVMRLL